MKPASSSLLRISRVAWNGVGEYWIKSSSYPVSDVFVMLRGFVLVAAGTFLFSACGTYQYMALPALIRASPGDDFAEAAEAPHADIVIAQAAIPDAWRRNR